MKRTSIRLSDGRELIYFDEADDAVRILHDGRDLPPLITAAEIRHDVLLDEWVAVASNRQTRTHLPPSDQCPLCPSTDSRLTEIPAHDYDVVVFENRFPSFAEDVPDVPGTVDPGGALVERRPGTGRCEVVCFTAEHASSFSMLTPQRVRTVLEAWVDRTVALSELPGVEQVFPFENRGREIGVTLSHPHGQIYAYPFVTPMTRRMLHSARRHLAGTGRNLFDDVLASEVEADVRIVCRSEHWTAFVPAAARWPFEVHVFPNRRVPDLPALDEEQRLDFGPLYLAVLRQLDGLFGVPMPYISAWHQAPVRGEHSGDRDLAALHLRLFTTRRDLDKLKFVAGSESGMGVFINDIAPENAAELLRAARP
jgi:UDPglucose--hexose-1-phosphate uridylyltransferase